MKKIVYGVMMLLVLAVSSSYAETAATANQANQPTKQTATTAESNKPQENKAAANQSSGSVYDSIRSGWNKFIDLLAGPKQ